MIRLLRAAWEWWMRLVDDDPWCIPIPFEELDADGLHALGRTHLRVIHAREQEKRE